VNRPATSRRRRPPAGRGVPVELARARAAVFTVFALGGVVIATWLSRIPHVRDHLDLTPGQLGRILLFVALGSVLALPTAGLVVNRLGARRTVAGAALLTGLGTLLVGVGADALTNPVAVAVGLFGLGFGIGTWDVSMNVEGAEVERRLGRTLMPRLHAGFSLGTVVGAGLGAVAAGVQLPVWLHLGVVGVLTLVVAPVASRFFLPAAATGPGPDPAASRGARPSLRASWREPRTLLLGVLVLAAALSEGIASDWLAVGLVDGLRASAAVGALGYAIFVAAMTVGRIWGTLAIDRFGRVRTLQISGALTAAGVLLVGFGGSLPVALTGAVVWGAGTALGFPVGMSAAADDPVRAPVRVSVVASIGYVAFLAGPPLLGWLGDHLGVQRALLVVLAAAAVGTVVAGAARPGAGAIPPAAGATPPDDAAASAAAPAPAPPSPPLPARAPRR
jgi:fucose permease